jgi:DNA modification methylase
VCIWNKSNGGMGTFYRSKHELVLVFKAGTASHTNSFGLGESGRYRTNVWDYAGVNTLRAGRSQELAMHPTVKPVAMLADAIRDVTRRGAIVLDPFAGSGSTLIAAEKTGRQARCIEFEAKYCDVIVRRWQAYTGKAATFEGIDLTFEDFEGARVSSPARWAARPLPPAGPAQELPQ